MVDFVATHLPLQEFVYEPVAIDNVATVDQTHIRVTFTRGVEDNAALNNITNYSFVPALTVVSVTSEAVYKPTYVDIEVSAMLGLTLYTINIDVIV